MSITLPNTFDALKHYVSVRLQQGVPLFDADWNEMEDIRRYELRSFLRWFVGDGVPQGSKGFRIAEARNDQGNLVQNNFSIIGGDGTPEGAGRCLVDGLEARLEDVTIKYTDQKLKIYCDQQDVVPYFAPINEDRYDLVYLDMWEKLVTPQEESSLIHSELKIETCARIARKWVVRVKTGVGEKTKDVPQDVKQNEHVYYPLARIFRKKDVEVISTDDITDLRRTGAGCKNGIWWGNNSRLSADQGGSIELGGDPNMPGVGTPYIDFHYSGKKEDRNVRIINDDDGRLSIYANVLSVRGNLLFRANKEKPDDPGDIIFQDYRGNEKARIWSRPQQGGGLHLCTNKANNPNLSIDANGYVGIGTSEPQESLQIGTGMTFHNGGHKVIGFGWSPSEDKTTGKKPHTLQDNCFPAEIRWDPGIWNVDQRKRVEGKLSLGIDSSWRKTGELPVMNQILTVTPTGNVGIGTNAPKAKLDVNGNIAVNGAPILAIVGVWQLFNNMASNDPGGWKEKSIWGIKTNNHVTLSCQAWNEFLSAWGNSVIYLYYE